LSFLDKDFSGKDAEEALTRAGIVVNKNTVPGENKSPFVTSGIRIGSPALTARGMKTKEFSYIAGKIADILDDISNVKLQDSINKEIHEFTKDFIIYNKSIF
jgi:glycine hydroxymethyltransferase